MSVFSLGRLVSRALLVASVLPLTGAGQQQDELVFKLHIVWTTNYNMNYSHEKQSARMTDELKVIYDASMRAQAPAGSNVWEMTSVPIDEQLAVSGGGSGTAKGQDEKGNPSSYSQSWSWVLKDFAKPLGGGVSIASDGTFSVNLPGESDIHVEPEIHPGSESSDLKGAVTKSIGAIMLTPRIGTGAGYVGAGPDFWSQFHGTFDPKSRSFSKHGTASASAVLDRSTGLIPGLDSGANTTVEVNYSLSFNQEPEDVEAILIPQKDTNDQPYESWIPQGGPDEDTAGNAFPVDVELRIKGTDKKPRAKANSFQFELVDVSKQKGVCMNWPPKDSTKQTPDFDLKIDKDANPGLKPGKDGQSATSGPDLQQSSVSISSYDWGAWGSLKVTAKLDNGQTVTAHLQNQSNITQLKIPKDDNNNHIADAWEKTNNPPSTDAESDDDDFPQNEGPQGDDDAGDGLSLYEEYRGFMIQGEHVSTSPKQKDVFIHDRHLLGLGSFGMSHLAAHLIKENEFSFEKDDEPNPRVINFNHGDFAHLGNEHVIELVDNQVEGGLGVTEGGPDVPKFIRYAAVDRKQCLASTYKQLEVQVTIAHELGHATNVAHHGDGNYPVPYAGSKYISPKLCSGPNLSAGVVAAVGGQNSGAQECIMRYYRAQYIESEGGAYCLPTTGANGNAVFLRGTRYGPTQTPGTIFCTSNAGTGMNGRYVPYGTANLGDATRGDCAHQFCVNDPKHTQKRIP